MKDITFAFPEKPPKVYFTRDVNYLETGFMSIKAKYPDGANFILLNPQGKTIMTVAGLHEFFSYHLYRFTWEDTEGTYTAQLRKGGTVVASDTTEVKHMPQCEEGFQECIHGDLWKCVNEAMKLVEENSKACVRDGFYNTNESAPSVLRLDVGTKDIMITKDGYEDLILRNLEVIKGKTTSVAGVMVPKIRGYISCKSVPSGAGIWVKEIWTSSQATVATKTEIAKSEFIAEIQKLGKIKLEKILTSTATLKTWIQSPLFGVNIRYIIVSNHRPRHITISNMSVRNPPMDVKDISFTDSSLGGSNWEKETFNRVEALEAIGKLPFAGFGFTSKVTPATIAFSPKTYAVKFKMGGYKEKVVSGVVVKEGKTTSVSATLEKAGALPPSPPEEPFPPSPEEGKFNLSEVGENHLPEWITGYACSECSGYWEYKCPAGYKRTECVPQPTGTHGCCSRCSVVFVKCEGVVTPPVTPPVTKTVTFKSVPMGASILLKKK